MSSISGVANASLRVVPQPGLLQRGLFFSAVFSSAISDAAIRVAAGLVIAAGTQRANRGEIKAGSRLCLSLASIT
jgi:hypothetical protein